MLHWKEFFNLTQSDSSHFLFESSLTPWEPLKGLKEKIERYIQENKSSTPSSLHPSSVIEENVLIEEGVTIEPGCYIQGPTVIKKGATVRHGAYIRGGVWVAEGALVGHSTEVKNSILLKGAKAAHFAYVGDSILGQDVNLGAGTKLANVRADMSKENLKLYIEKQWHDSGLRKFGAILGDRCSLGCNSVTNPGTVLAPDCLAYPLAMIKGVASQAVIFKTPPSKTSSRKFLPPK